MAVSFSLFSLFCLFCFSHFVLLFYLVLVYALFCFSHFVLLFYLVLVYANKIKFSYKPSEKILMITASPKISRTEENYLIMCSCTMLTGTIACILHCDCSQ